MKEYKNTKKQGDAGLGVAIGWFTLNGFGVSIPLTDSQDYDLIVDENDVLKRVQVKTTTYKTKYNIYAVNLSVKGGNRTSVGTIKKFDRTKVDYLFVLTKDMDKYLIPSLVITNPSILHIGKKYQQYKLP